MLSLRGLAKPRIVNLLLAVFEVDGPRRVKLRKGPNAGQEVAVLNLILGADDGVVCHLTAWRNIADIWGGLTDAPGVRYGDIVFLISQDIFTRLFRDRQSE